MRSLNIRDARAVIWFTRIEEGAMTEQRMRLLKRWLIQPANHDAFETMRAAWHNTPPLKAELASVLKPSESKESFKPGLAPQPLQHERERAANRNARLSLVSQEAAHWYFLCVDEPAILRADRGEFLAWVRRSPENIAELFRIAQLDGKLSRLKLTMRSVGLTRSNVVEFTTTGSPYGMHRWNRELDDLEGGSSAGQRIRSFKFVAVAASLVLGVAFALVGLNFAQSERVVTTGASQWHHMTLPDGTSVHVDAFSRIEVAYTDEERLVHVYEGSAVFDVAKDPRRPFIARTSLVDAMAVGTRYGVSIGAGVTTTVSEGKVRVTGRARPDGETVLLSAGEELQVPDGSLTAVHPAQVDAGRKLLWARGLLNLGGLTVAQGIEELNRRNRVQIVLDSPTLGPKVVRFATVRVDSPESYARAIARESGVTVVVDREQRLIRLSE